MGEPRIRRQKAGSRLNRRSAESSPKEHQKPRRAAETEGRKSADVSQSQKPNVRRSAREAGKHDLGRKELSESYDRIFGSHWDDRLKPDRESGRDDARYYPDNYSRTSSREPRSSAEKDENAAGVDET
jgi:hypothetical protein